MLLTSMLFAAISASTAQAVAAPCLADDLPALEAELRSGLENGQLAAPLQRAERAFAYLSCVKGVLDVVSLVRVEQVAGALALYADQQKNDQRARMWFSRAVALDPSLRIDPSLGEPVGKLYERVLNEAKGTTAVIEARQEFVVDGRVLPSGTSRTVIAGAHVIQRLDGEKWTTTVLMVDANQRTVLLGPILPPMAPTEVAVDTGACPEKPNQARSNHAARIALGSGGALMVAAGTTSLALWGRHLWDDRASIGPDDTTRLYGWEAASVAAIGVGGAAMLSAGVFLGTDGPTIGFSMRW